MHLPPAHWQLVLHLDMLQLPPEHLQFDLQFVISNFRSKGHPQLDDEVQTLSYVTGVDEGVTEELVGASLVLHQVIPSQVA